MLDMLLFDKSNAIHSQSCSPPTPVGLFVHGQNSSAPSQLPLTRLDHMTPIQEMPLLLDASCHWSPLCCHHTPYPECGSNA